jgi:hypothetical protein
VQRNPAYRVTIFTGLEDCEEKLLTLVAAFNCCPVMSMHTARPISSHKLIFLTNTTNWLQEIFKNTE